MTDYILMVVLSIVFLATFVTRNLMVKAQVKQPIRASDPWLAASMIFTNLCIFITIFATLSEGFYERLGIIWPLRTPFITGFGFFLFALSIVIGWFVSAQLRASWRVGVPVDQKTELIQQGIYRYIRNPYFLSYFVMFIGQFFVRPSVVMVVLIVSAIVVFHRMILKEEAYLLQVHGPAYEQYKRATGRYMPCLKKHHI